MIANSEPKNIGAIIANSTAVAPRLSPRNRRFNRRIADQVALAARARIPDIRNSPNSSPRRTNSAGHGFWYIKETLPFRCAVSRGFDCRDSADLNRLPVPRARARFLSIQRSTLAALFLRRAARSRLVGHAIAALRLVDRALEVLVLVAQAHRRQT
jgi:hypothetical protein